MNATDLMIGDWLYYRGKFNAFPFKVEQITKKKVGYHPDPDSNVMAYLRLNEEITPIPLTKEILEVNGFRFNVEETNGPIQQIYNHYTEFFDFPLGEGFSIEHNTENNVFWITDHVFISFKYVHELQHVLKLCGISKKVII